uniref:Pali-domain-containing protein n=1 Tax=Mycena chlorophos TaxID=658473 RepID=A0ABQ0MB14_MYCCL|nr:predicted protein [Mycena chlorophos]
MSTAPLNFTIDNISPLIQYTPVGAWSEGTASDDPLAGDYFDGTFTLCTTQGSQASFTFNGTQVYVFGAKRSNHAPYSVSLDGETSNFNGFSQNAIFSTLYVSPVLTSGLHTVSVTNERNDNNLTFLDIDRIIWTTDASDGGESNTIEDTATGFAYSPASAWSTDLTDNKLSGFSQNNGHVTATSGASATLTFTGDHVEIFGPIGPTISRFTVSLDGANTGTFNATKENYIAQAPLFAASGLSSGKHTLKLTSDPADAGQLLAIDFAQVAAGTAGAGGSSSKTNSSGSSPTGAAGASSSSKKSSAVGPAVGGAIGGIAVLALLGVLFFCFLRRRRRERDSESNPAGFGDKYGATAAAPNNYTMSSLGASQAYSTEGSQAHLTHQPSVYSVHSAPFPNPHSAALTNPWSPGHGPEGAAMPPAMPMGFQQGPQRRTFYTVNDNELTSPTSDGGSSLSRSVTTQSAGAAGLGAGSYRRKGEALPLPPTANVPLPPGAPRMHVPGREQDMGPVDPEQYGGELLPPNYEQATDPYPNPSQSQSYYSNESTTSDPYGGTRYLHAVSAVLTNYAHNTMSRVFCIPGIVFLLCALVLSIIVSVSLPFLTDIDFVRVHFGDGVATNGQGMTELRFGIWAPCYFDTDGTKTCFAASHGYSVSISNQDKTADVIIGGSWTRGLAVHPVATAVTFIAFCMAFSTHHLVTLLASLMSFLAATLTLIAFAIDIALYAFVHHEIGKLPDVSGKTDTSVAFWMTFVTLILLLLAGCTVCFGRRKDRLSGASSYPMSSYEKPSFFRRFRRN